MITYCYGDSISTLNFVDYYDNKIYEFITREDEFVITCSGKILTTIKISKFNPIKVLHNDGNNFILFGESKTKCDYHIVRSNLTSFEIYKIPAWIDTKYELRAYDDMEYHDNTVYFLYYREDNDYDYIATYDFKNQPVLNTSPIKCQSLIHNGILVQFYSRNIIWKGKQFKVDLKIHCGMKILNDLLIYAIDNEKKTLSYYKVDFIGDELDLKPVKYDILFDLYLNRVQHRAENWKILKKINN